MYEFPPIMTAFAPVGIVDWDVDTVVVGVTVAEYSPPFATLMYNDVNALLRTRPIGWVKD